MSNVKDFGASGDGVIDDRKAICHAMEQGEGLVEFPRGTYRISAPIEIDLEKSGFLALDGSGGTARLVMAGEGPAIRVIGSYLRGSANPASVRPNVWSQQRMPTIRHLEITAEHPAGDGIELIGTFQATIEGVLIRRVRHGIRVTQQNRNVAIHDAHIYHNTGVGIYLEDTNLHQVNITGNHISYNRLGGIRIERSEIRNLQITGNDIEYNNHASHGTPSEPTAEIYIDTSADGATVNEVTIASNTIQATVSAGGANLRIIDKASKDRPPGLFAVAGNIIGSQEVNIHLVHFHGIVLSGNCIYSCSQRNVVAHDCDQLNITGNNFRRHTHDRYAGIRLVDCRDSLLSGCILRDETLGGQGWPLLEMQRCRRISVQGSQFFDAAPVAIDADDCRDINITGCMIVPTGESCDSLAAIRFRGDASGNQVNACNFGNWWPSPVLGLDTAPSHD